MQRELVQNYLQDSGMNERQAIALSHILAETSTKDDFRLIDARFDSFEQRMDGRFEYFEQKMDARFEYFEQKMNARFETFEQKMSARFETFEQKMNARFETFEHKMDGRLESLEQRLRADLTWRFLTMMILMATVMTILDIVID